MKKVFNLQNVLWVLFAVALSFTLTLSSCGEAEEKKEEEKKEQMDEATQDDEAEMKDEESMDDAKEMESDTMKQDSAKHEEHPSGGSEHPNG